MKKELIHFEKELLKNPKMGTPLGKIRLAIESKGKSGGARIITHLEIDLRIDENTTNIFLITIYDKAELENISKKEIERIIKEMNKNNPAYNISYMNIPSKYSGTSYSPERYIYKNYKK